MTLFHKMMPGWTWKGKAVMGTTKFTVRKSEKEKKKQAKNKPNSQSHKLLGDREGAAEENFSGSPDTEHQ